MEELTAKQIHDFKEAFSFFDKDHDGKITSFEVGTVMRSLGLKPTEAELQSMIDEFVPTSNDSIEFDQFCKMMQKKMMDKDTEEELKEAFKVFDKDGTGSIHVAELRHVMGSLGESLSETEVEAMIKLTGGSDGKVNYTSFAKVLMSS
eukprot:Lithocolla_globosa_v1_NODE_11373_length_514_cov_44.444444.p1 type:complete len:148 gc:universal NODE_11373_length_514_cov_44.444444:469-26(-)